MIERLHYETKGFFDLIDITDDISRVVEKAKVNEGIVFVFVKGSTAGITTLEFEPGLKKDFQEAYNRLFPEAIEYKHNQKWGDGN